MKIVLKGWIADNSVTADKTDKILVLIHRTSPIKCIEIT